MLGGIYPPEGQSAFEKIGFKAWDYSEIPLK
jgi:hypothetical protein